MKAKTLSHLVIYLMLALPAWSQDRSQLPSISAPAFFHNSLTQVAKSLGVPLVVVKDVHALDLDPTLSWILMKVSARGKVSGAQMMVDRATRSWGEVAALHGQDWVKLNQEIREQLRAGNLSAESPTARQIFRTASNKPGPP